MERNRCGAAIGVPELFVGSLLTNFLKPQPLQVTNNFLRFKNRQVAHCSGDGHLLSANKFRLQMWLAVFQQHAHDLLKVLVEFVEGTALGMRAWKSRDIADKKTGVGAFLNHSRVGFHAYCL